MDNNIRISTFTGTGAAINVSCGFIPDYVRILNVTDGDITHEWFRGMTDGTGVDTALAVAGNADNDISEYAGDSTHSPGFTVGTDASENAKVYRYIALRNASAQP